jgi:hypothetical protein
MKKNLLMKKILINMTFNINYIYKIGVLNVKRCKKNFDFKLE